jgi:hypothetical protein
MCPELRGASAVDAQVLEQRIGAVRHLDGKWQAAFFSHARKGQAEKTLQVVVFDLDCRECHAMD